MKYYMVGDFVTWEGRRLRIDRNHLNGMYTLSNNEVVTNYELEAGVSAMDHDKLRKLAEELNYGNGKV